MRKINLSKSKILAIVIGAMLIALSFWLALVVRVDVEEARRFIESFGILAIPIFAAIYLQAVLVPAIVYKHEKKKLEAKKNQKNP